MNHCKQFCSAIAEKLHLASTTVSNAVQPLSSSSSSFSVSSPSNMSSPPESPNLIQHSDTPSDTQSINRHDMWQYPSIRWSFSNIGKLGPTAQVSRGQSSASQMPEKINHQIDHLPLNTSNGMQMTWRDAIDASHTDGIIVLHHGQIIYEKYFGELSPDQPHILMSCTKSIIGMIAAMLIDDGLLDDQARVAHYIPELNQTAYGDATIRQVLDMTVGVQYSEDYSNPDAEIWQYIASGGWFSAKPQSDASKTLHRFLKTLKKSCAHDLAFSYITPNAEVLGWVIQNVLNDSIANIVSKSIWQKIGAQQDAYFAVDSEGTALSGAGLATTLRDFARLGEMFRLDGYYNHMQIMPKSVITNIKKGGDAEKINPLVFPTLPQWSYRNMWWIAPPQLAVFAMRGIHGQTLWIDSNANLVIAKLSSAPIAANSDSDQVTLPAFKALSDYLIQLDATETQ